MIISTRTGKCEAEWKRDNHHWRSGSHANELQDEIDRKNVWEMMADNRYSSLTQHPMPSPLGPASLFGS